MEIINTSIEGLYIINPVVHTDARGYFFESYSKKDFALANIHYDFIQDNVSFSHQGTIRGLHFQKGEHSQAKLVSVTSGIVLDVALDLRPHSPTFGHYEAVLLSSENKQRFLIPRGFAHGFSVLSDHAEFTYKCDNAYCKESEAGIRFNDIDLNIDWRIKPNPSLISEKDLILPTFKEFCSSCI
ncbi:MAG: dTDP-4-dehydrorhamnose 3,5-epimerase [Akkermansia sp.]